MPISFIPEAETEKKERKISFKIPVLVWWIVVPILILGGVLYSLLQVIPESEITVDPDEIGINIEDLQNIEGALNVFNDKQVQNLFKQLTKNPFPKVPKVPSEIIGRPNPFLD